MKTELNGYSYMLGALYHVQGSFSQLRDLMQALPFDVKTLPYAKDPLVTALDKTIAQYTNITGPLDQNAARMRVIGDDLVKIRKVLDNPEIVASIDSRATINDVLEATLHTLAQLMRENGVDVVEETPIFIVDHYPHPFEERACDAWAADGGNLQAHGITPGVYFLRNRLRPFYSEYLLCHEVVHVALAQKDPDLSAHGLEEGIAEILGAYEISGHVLGWELTKNLFIYNRLGSEVNPFWEQYVDFARAAAIIYRSGGAQALYEIVAGGRQAVKAVEAQILSGNMPSYPTTPAAHDLLDYLLLGFPRHTVSSPLAFHIAQHVQPGLSVEEIAKRSGCEQEATQAGLRELHTDFNMIGLGLDGSVTWSNCELYSSGHGLRYHLVL